MKNSFLMLSSMLVGCSCATLNPVHHPLTATRQPFVKQAEDIRKAAEASMRKNHKNDSSIKIVTSHLLFATSNPSTDSVVVIYTITTADFPNGDPTAIVFLKSEEGWRPAGEFYETVQTPLPNRRQVLATTGMNQFEAKLKAAGVSYKQLALMWATTRANDRFDSAVVLYEIDGEVIAFITFLHDGSWQVLSEQYK